MLQQTNVKTVAPYYAKFLARWPTIAELAEERLEEVLKLWAGLGLLRACSQSSRLCSHGPRKPRRQLPETEAELRSLPGIGAYTAAAIAAIAFDRKATPVDGNIERVIARLFAVEEPLPGVKPKIQALAATLTPERRAGDFAQAMMDLGATICTPKRPACALCPWSEPCIARKRGDQETFPRKTPKAEGKLRRGAAFVVTRADGALLVRTRPDKGLLAKMTEVPTTQWSHDFDERGLMQPPPSATQDEMAVASRTGRGAPCLHAFPAGACGLSHERRNRHPRAERHALHRSERDRKRSVPERHAQGHRPWTARPKIGRL